MAVLPEIEGRRVYLEVIHCIRAGSATIRAFDGLSGAAQDAGVASVLEPQFATLHGELERLIAMLQLLSRSLDEQPSDASGRQKLN